MGPVSALLSFAIVIFDESVTVDEHEIWVLPLEEKEK
jgi:hypothetical protein